MDNDFNPQNTQKEPNIKKKRRRKTSKKRTVVKVSYVVTAIAAVAFIALFIFGFNFVYGVVKATDSFDISKLDSQEITKFWDKNGNLFYKLGSSSSDNGWRENVTYDDLPQVLVDAVVAAEDSRFFEHNGFDLPRIVKAVVGNFTGSTYSGASTITQQIIKKSYYPEEQSTYQRKIGEIYLAIQADEAMSKEDILISYLNKIYFGKTLSSIGVQAASEYYFNKDVTELTLPEAALLAGTLNSPYYYDPYNSIEKATTRRDIILDLMCLHGYISVEERDYAKQIKVEDTLVRDNDSAGYKHYFAYIDVVIEEIKEEMGIDPSETSVDVYTYLDPDLQVYLDQIAAGDYFDFPDNELQLASSVQETTTGRVVGVIGGRDYVDGSEKIMGFNRASTGTASPGSSMKPITAYSAAFEFLDWSTAHTVDDSPYTTPSGISIYNWDRANHNNVQVTSALSNSWNIPAIRAFEAVNSSIGSEAYKAYLKGFGLTIDDADGVTEGDFNSLYAIGAMAKGWTPMQIAGAYATIGNDGIYIQPHTINYVVVQSDNRQINRDQEIQDAAASAVPACSPETAFMVRHVMLGYAGTGSYTYISVYGVQIAGKTGTATYSDNTSRATWMAGLSPDYAVATWLGYDSGNTVVPTYYKSLSHQTTGLILRYLHSSGTSVNQFSSAPSTLTYATIIKGINDPYIIAGDNVSSDDKVTGYFKGTKRPSSMDTNISIESLNSFSATSNTAETQISVSFAEYPDTSLTTGFNAEDTTTLKTLFGRIMYTTVIKDTNGNVLHSQSSESSSYTINYTFTSDIIVTGYYSYAKSSSIVSNERSVTIKSSKATITLPEINAMVLIDGQSVSSGAPVAMSSSTATLDVSVTPSYNDNIISIAVTGLSYNKNYTGADASFTLTSSGSYTVIITEQDKNKTVKRTKTFVFTLTEASSGNDDGNTTP